MYAEFSSLPPCFQQEEFPFWIDHYEVMELIGKGGMGKVYRAYDEKLERIVALKILSQQIEQDPKSINRFRREGLATARLQHPYIVTIYDLGEYKENFYLVMEYVEGPTLQEYLQDNQPSFAWCARFLSQVAEALYMTHREGIVHRDLKPNNVIVWQDQPKILDFGLAKLLDSSTTSTGNLLGTPNYMAPEQIVAKSDPVGPQTDIYAMGALLYKMLTTRPPFTGTSIEIFTQILEQEVVSPREYRSDIPRNLEAICLKCLAKKTRHRYYNAKMLAQDLQAYLNAKPLSFISSSFTSKVQHALSFRETKLYLLIIILLTTFLVIEIQGVLFQSHLFNYFSSNKDIPGQSWEKDGRKLQEFLQSQSSLPTDPKTVAEIQAIFQKSPLSSSGFYPGLVQQQQGWLYLKNAVLINEQDPSQVNKMLSLALDSFDQAWQQNPNDHLACFLGYFACLVHPEAKIKERKTIYLNRLKSIQNNKTANRNWLQGK